MHRDLRARLLSSVRFGARGLAARRCILLDAAATSRWRRSSLPRCRRSRTPLRRGSQPLETRHFELAPRAGGRRRDAGDLRALREHVLGDRPAVQPGLRRDAPRQSRRRSMVARRGHADLPADADDPARGAAHRYRRQRTGDAPLLLHDREAGHGRRSAGPQGLELIRSASAPKAGPRRSARPKSCRRLATPCGTCRRPSARSTPSAAIRCRASCSRAPTIRSASSR